MNKRKRIQMNKEKKYSFKNLQSKIEAYGFQYSAKDFAIQTFMFIAIMIVVGFFLKLQPYYITIVCIAVGLMMPSMITSQFKYFYEQNRFNDLQTYLETMAYSFKKNPKILLALKDTAEVTKGKMNKLVNQAIYMIENDYSDTIYKDALNIIQKEYECSRIIQLHKFICKVEEQGGEYVNALDILIDDIDKWAQRTYLFQKDRSDIKKKIMISLLLSLGICSTTLFMVPPDFDFTGSSVYQIATTVTLIIFVGIYTITQTKMNGSWLENDMLKNADQIRKDYDLSHSTISKKDKKKTNQMIVVLAALAGACLLMNSIPAAAGVLVLMWLVYNKPKNKIKHALKRTMREIQKEVPGWCREIALNLQTENVYNSIVLTLDECPIVLEKAVQELLMEIDKNPTSMVPYDNFLAEFNIPEVSRMMKTLYSLSEYGAQDAESQINKIIAQNNALLEKAEILKNEDSMAGIGFLTYIPMFLGSVKMMIDLFLLCGNFLAITQNVL